MRMFIYPSYFVIICVEILDFLSFFFTNIGINMIETENVFFISHLYIKKYFLNLEEKIFFLLNLENIFSSKFRKHFLFQI